MDVKNYVLPVGTVVQERYRIEKHLGSGGFGITYKAWDTVFQVNVCLKEFFPMQFATRDVSVSTFGKISGGRDPKLFAQWKQRYLE